MEEFPQRIAMWRRAGKILTVAIVVSLIVVFSLLASLVGVLNTQAQSVTSTPDAMSGMNMVATRTPITASATETMTMGSMVTAAPTADMSNSPYAGGAKLMV